MHMKSMLYTRTGDTGETSLVGGERVAKDSLRLESYGTVDELSSQLGVVAAAQGVGDEVKGQLQQIQNELFNIGGCLATDTTSSAKWSPIFTNHKARSYCSFQPLSTDNGAPSTTTLLLMDTDF